MAAIDFLSSPSLPSRSHAILASVLDKILLLRQLATDLPDLASELVGTLLERQRAQMKLTNGNCYADRPNRALQLLETLQILVQNYTVLVKSTMEQLVIDRTAFTNQLRLSSRAAAISLIAAYITHATLRMLIARLGFATIIRLTLLAMAVAALSNSSNRDNDAGAGSSDGNALNGINLDTLEKQAQEEPVTVFDVLKQQSPALAGDLVRLARIYWRIGSSIFSLSRALLPLMLHNQQLSQIASSSVPKLMSMFATVSERKNAR